MTGMVRLSYKLGWVLLVLALVARALVYFKLGARMAEIQILPRNLLELSLVFFVVCVASEAYSRAGQK